MDTPEDGRWLTYDELARLRGITQQSAVKLSRRQHWRRQTGNRGTVRLFVPEEWLARPWSMDAPEQSGQPTGTLRDDGTAVETVLAALREAHAGEVGRLTEALAAANSRADRLDLLIETTRGELLAVEIKAGRETARADAAEAERRAAIERVDAATARADVAESRQRWAEDRVDGLRDLLTDAERRAVAAEDGRKAVLAQAEALERAEFERAARPLWRRIADAWRGQ
jgi:hypothetical protein